MAIFKQTCTEKDITFLNIRNFFHLFKTFLTNISFINVILALFTLIMIQKSQVKNIIYNFFFSIYVTDILNCY